MPHRVVRGRTRRPLIRKTFLAHALGVAPDRPVQELKRYLHAATLTSSSDQKIDLVMIEDMDHYGELLGQGIPLLRAEEGHTPRVVILPRRRYLLVLAALSAFSLDALYDLLTLTPWM